MTQSETRSAKEIFTGQAEPAASTRERLIEIALDLFYTYGFHAVGVDQVITRVGVTKTTFYNHFPSKDDLAVAALQRRDEWEAKAFLGQLRARTRRPADQLLAMFDILHAWFNDPAYRGCLFINAAAEFPLQHDPVHQAAQRSYDNMETFLRETAEAADLKRPEDLARKLVLLVEGAFCRRLISGDPQAAMLAKELAAAMLKNHRPGRRAMARQT